MTPKLKYIAAIAAIISLIGWYAYTDYSWPNRIVPKMELKGWRVAAVRANVIYPDRPWTFFKQPVESIWFIRHGQEIQPGVILTEVYRAVNPHSDEDTGAFHNFSDCKRFRVAVISNVADLKDPNYKPEWQDALEGPDIQGIQLFIAQCRPFYPNEAYEADRKCVNSTTLMRPKGAKTCAAEGWGLSVAEQAAPWTNNVAFPLITYREWDRLSQAEQDLYVKAFLESTSFTMYGYSPQNGDPVHNREAREVVQRFSDFTACAERENPRRWTPMYDWKAFGYLDRTAASQCWKITRLVCGGYAGKGDRTWTPVRLVSKEQWSSLSRRDRAIYVTSYVETSYELMKRARESDDLKRLQNCLATAGVEAVMDAVEATPIEWQDPLPWSISQAMGRACP